MKCPNCNTKLEHYGGENKEDFGCPNTQCPSIVDILYHMHVRVRNNWWFSPQYHIPFKYNNDWFTVVGPIDMFYDELSGAVFQHDPVSKIMKRTKKQYISSHNISGHNTIRGRVDYVEEIQFHLPYYALPVNEDFNSELDKLINRFKKLMILV